MTEPTVGTTFLFIVDTWGILRLLTSWEYIHLTCWQMMIPIPFGVCSVPWVLTYRDPYPFHYSCTSGGNFLLTIDTIHLFMIPLFHWPDDCCLLPPLTGDVLRWLPFSRYRMKASDCDDHWAHHLTSLLWEEADSIHWAGLPLASPAPILTHSGNLIHYHTMWYLWEATVPYHCYSASHLIIWRRRPSHSMEVMHSR